MLKAAVVGSQILSGWWRAELLLQKHSQRLQGAVVELILCLRWQWAARCPLGRGAMSALSRSPARSGRPGCLAVERGPFPRCSPRTHSPRSQFPVRILVGKKCRIREHVCCYAVRSPSPSLPQAAIRDVGLSTALDLVGWGLEDGL